jgi:DNA-binding IclR family transcriptional regulator
VLVPRFSIDRSEVNGQSAGRFIDGTLFHQMRVVKSQLTYCLELMSVMSDRARGMRLTDLALHLDAPKSSTQRLLDHLAQGGWVEQDEATGQYRLTMRLAMLGQRYLQSAGIADAAQAILDRLAHQTRELARLTVVDHHRLAWIGSAQGAPPGLRYEPSMGGSIVSFATANGKAWLATLSDDEAIAIAMKDGLGKRVPTRNLGPKVLKGAGTLRADLRVVRRRGYAIADQEAEAGVAAIAVAIQEPRSRLTLGTTSIAGPVVRITSDRHAEIVNALRASAADLALAWPAGQRRSANDSGRLSAAARRERL